MARLAAVFGALGLTVVADGCARDNPAFGLGLTGDSTTRGDDGTDPTRPGTTPGDDADTTMPPQSDDGADPSTSAGPVATETSSAATRRSATRPCRRARTRWSSPAWAPSSRATA